MERLVTKEDIQRYPELSQMGVSINQHFDVEKYAEQQGNSTPPTTPIPPQLAATKEEVVMAKKIAPKKTAPVKKAFAKSTPVKKELTQKPVKGANEKKVSVKKIQSPKKVAPKKTGKKK